MTLSFQPLRRVAMAFLWSILIWLSFAPLNAGQDKLRLLERGINVPYWSLAVVNGVWLLTVALLTPPLFFIVAKYPMAKPAEPFKPKRLAAYLLGVVPYLCTSLCVRWILLPPWNLNTQSFDRRSAQGFLWNAHLFALQTWDYVAVIVAAHAYEYFIHAGRKEVERAEIQQALAASELQALKAQLQPHFLFNTLHGISTLIDADQARAKSMILKLSGLLRNSLQYHTSDMVPLEQEMKFIDAYLDIEKMRLNGRLEIRRNLQTDTGQLLVPQLILQPLVENAIVHGIACSREGGWLQIAARRIDGRLELSVRNSVQGKSQPGLGLGLSSAKARLKHLFLEEATLTFTKAVPGGDGEAAATVVLPALAAYRAEHFAEATREPTSSRT